MQSLPQHPSITAVALLLCLTACSRSAPEQAAPVTVPTPAALPSPTSTPQPVQTAEPVAALDAPTEDAPPEGTSEGDTTAASEESETQTGTFSPEEIRGFCAAVQQNARNFTQFHIQTVLAGRWESLDQTFAKLDESYQFDNSRNLSEGDRKALSSTLWVTKAFVERAEPLLKLVSRANPSNIPSFDQANEAWCQNSMRGGQPPFEFMDSEVPYVEIKRS